MLQCQTVIKGILS